MHLTVITIPVPVVWVENVMLLWIGPLCGGKWIEHEVQQHRQHRQHVESVPAVHRFAGRYQAV